MNWNYNLMSTTNHSVRDPGSSWIAHIGGGGAGTEVRTSNSGLQLGTPTSHDNACTNMLCCFVTRKHFQWRCGCSPTVRLQCSWWSVAQLWDCGVPGGQCWIYKPGGSGTLRAEGAVPAGQGREKVTERIKTPQCLEHIGLHLGASCSN